MTRVSLGLGSGERAATHQARPARGIHEPDALSPHCRIARRARRSCARRRGAVGRQRVAAVSAEPLMLARRGRSRAPNRQTPSVPRQYRVRAKSFDLGAIAGHSTGDASCRSRSRCDPIRPVDASRPAARDSCSAPSVGRARSFEWALSRIRPPFVADLATGVASVDRRAAAGQAGNR